MLGYEVGYIFGGVLTMALNIHGLKTGRSPEAKAASSDIKAGVSVLLGAALWPIALLWIAIEIFGAWINKQ